MTPNDERLRGILAVTLVVALVLAIMATAGGAGLLPYVELTWVLLSGTLAMIGPRAALHVMFWGAGALFLAGLRFGMPAARMGILFEVWLPYMFATVGVGGIASVAFLERRSARRRGVVALPPARIVRRFTRS